MNLIKGWRILQIIAAQPGWKAVHCEESENRQVKISNRAVICWALVESVEEDDALRTEVRGVVQESSQLVIVGDLIKTDKNGDGGVDGNQYFLGYNDPEAHKESDYWVRQANLRLKTETGSKAEKLSACSAPNDDSRSEGARDPVNLMRFSQSAASLIPRDPAQR
jgi:hypothetical protein